MDFPFEYDHVQPLVFGGTLPTQTTFDDASVVILPCPVDRTTSYVGGTRNGPHEILQASSHMELWDEEVGVDVHGVGIFTLPEMELPFGEMAAVVDEIERVAYEIIGRDKFLVTIGGEHSITPPLVSAAARKYTAAETSSFLTPRPSVWIKPSCVSEWPSPSCAALVYQSSDPLRRWFEKPKSRPTFQAMVCSHLMLGSTALGRIVGMNWLPNCTDDWLSPNRYDEYCW